MASKSGGVGRGGAPGGGRGRDERGGGLGRPDRRGGPGEGGGYRVVGELSALEKALGKADVPAQVRPLDEIVRALRSMRLRALEDLDLATRGKLITTLLRVARQPRPASEAAPAGADSAPAPDAVEHGASTLTALSAAEDAGISEGSPIGTATESSEGSPPADAVAEEPAVGAQDAAAAPGAAGPAEFSSASPAPAAALSVPGYADVLFRVGLAWAAVHETERADTAFAAAGRRPSASELGGTAGTEREKAPEQGAAGPRGRKRTAERPAREVKPPRPGPSAREMPFQPTGDWASQAEQMEAHGRTRDAGRLHERNGSPAEASRLFEGGGDLGGALRNALGARDTERARTLLARIPPEEARPILEKAQAWELLMEAFVKAQRFDEVAKLYERARQFDQAGLAWERASKLGAARKAFERAGDLASAERVRGLEVSKLSERGDRLGAALLLAQGGRRAEAVELLRTLPAPKAFRFLQQIKLEAEARVLAEGELARATGEGGAAARARWLELLGRVREAAEAWEAADRKEKAFPLWERAGEFGRGAGVAEAAGNRNEAIRLYRRAGADANADRLEALPPEPPAAVRPSPDPGAEETTPREALPEAAAPGAEPA